MIFNRVGSDHHAELLREALAASASPCSARCAATTASTAPERHLGLVPAAEREPRRRVRRSTRSRRPRPRYVDLDAVERLARAAPPADGPAWEARAGRRAGAGAYRDRTRPGVLVPLRGEPRAAAPRPAPSSCRSTRSPTSGCRRAPTRSCWPAASPRSSAPSWRPTPALRAEVAAFAQSGRPILAECGGLLYLCAELDGRPMCGVLPARGAHGRSADARLPRGDGGHRDAVDRRRREPCAGTSSTTPRSSRSAPARRPRGR